MPLPSFANFWRARSRLYRSHLSFEYICVLSMFKALQDLRTSAPLRTQNVSKTTRQHRRSLLKETMCTVFVVTCCGCQRNFVNVLRWIQCNNELNTTTASYSNQMFVWILGEAQQASNLSRFAICSPPRLVPILVRGMSE